ncbi:hypothetical protein [Enterobacter hormaechei]|uniref:hypothetical protein n=1 Tax=Enterobacter hormaechei TaxID=158836 RepID=UPI0007504D75|nr:hypothetical protein [Enterobacter hormaechei]
MRVRFNYVCVFAFLARFPARPNKYKHAGVLHIPSDATGTPEKHDYPDVKNGGNAPLALHHSHDTSSHQKRDTAANIFTGMALDNRT